MRPGLSIPADIGSDALTYLRAEAERIIFMRGTHREADGNYEITEVLKLHPRDIALHSFHVSLTDRGRQTVFSWASRGGDILVEAHSHGELGDPATFSRTDIEGLSDWVPHVQWRMGGRAYAALVVGPSTIDGLFWATKDDVLIPAVYIGETSVNPTGRSLARLREASGDQGE